MSRPAVLLCALLLAVALGACGSGQSGGEDPVLPRGQLDKPGYVDAFESSAGGLTRRFGLTKELSPDASAADQAERVANLQRLLRAWADRLATLRPPAEARRAHERFIAGVRRFAVDLQRARAALDRGDEKGATRLLDTGAVLSRATRDDLVAARRAFHDHGYDMRNLDKSPVETPESNR
jgi:hypothetical protein